MNDSTLDALGKSKRASARKRTLYIHIGAHKAGSTSLQLALAENAEKLRAAEACYIAHGRFADAHHFVYYAALDPAQEKSAAVFGRISAEIEESSARNFFISAEGLETLKAPESLTPFHALKQAHDLEVVVLFLTRHHGEQMNSAYVQAVRELAYSGVFAEFALPRLKRTSRRYRAPIEFWSALADRFIVAQFSPETIQELLQTELGVTLDLPHVNASINALAVEALRLTAAAQMSVVRDRRVGLRKRNEALIDRICERAAKRDQRYPKFWGFSPWQWDKLTHSCAEDAEFLRARFGVTFAHRDNRERAMVRAPYSVHEVLHLRDVLGEAAEAALGSISPS